MSRSHDLLVEAIANGTLDDAQRRALADLIDLLAAEMAGDGIVRPGTFLDQTIDEAARWGVVRKMWRERRLAFYPQVRS